MTLCISISHWSATFVGNAFSWHLCRGMLRDCWLAHSVDSAIAAEFPELENSSPLKDELRTMPKAPTRGGDGANTKRPAVTSAAFICLCGVESIPRIYETFQPGERDHSHVLSVFFLHLLDVINQVISACKSHPEY